MDLNYSNINLFPSPIHQFDVNGFSEIQNELIDYAYDLKKENQKSVNYFKSWWLAIIRFSCK